jgi:hypothetical protein
MPGLDKRRILQGSASNLTRVILGMLISLVLPHFLVHHLGTAEYSAWVLILQLAAYVNFLDLGLQTAIGKFVAEYTAAGNAMAARKTVSTAFTVMVGAGLLGALAIFGMVWQVPRLFTQMPGALVSDVRGGLLAVGVSVAFALPFGVFLATFTGLQEYGDQPRRLDGGADCALADARHAGPDGVAAGGVQHRYRTAAVRRLEALCRQPRRLRSVRLRQANIRAAAGVLRHSYRLDHRQPAD